MSIIENLTLKQLSEEAKILPEIAHFASRVLADTYDKFIKILYQDIDQIIQVIQENPELRKNDEEDRLTIEIVGNLRRSGYKASHDTKVGGHTDLLVQHSNGYKWIGEAKIRRGNSNLWEGFLQLTERYSICDSNQKDGGMLIYIKVAHANQVMKDWQDHLEQKNLVEYQKHLCPKNEISFYSKHMHTKSGLLFTVRHMPILLYFNPQDSLKDNNSQPKKKYRKKETK